MRMKALDGIDLSRTFREILYYIHTIAEVSQHDSLAAGHTSSSELMLNPCFFITLQPVSLMPDVGCWAYGLTWAASARNNSRAASSV